MGRQVIDPNFFKKKTVMQPASEQETSKEVVPMKKEPAPEPPAKPEPAERPRQPARPQTPPAKPQTQARPHSGEQRPAPKAGQKQEKSAPKPQTPVKTSIRLGHKTTIAINEAAAALRDVNQPKLAENVEKVLKEVGRNRFTVAVVGEFSRGKSTFINRLLDKAVVPVGILPTTALLTRIRHNPTEVLVAYDEKGSRRKAVVLEESAWDDLIADNFEGEDPKGSVLVGTQSPWLLHSGIELMDTPGADDLEEERTKVISDALLKADGAVIAVSATLPLSMSEKFFIEQRLIARKTPFMMMIVTKMDQIPVARRDDMLDYIQGKLKQWEMNIPVFVPYDLDMPTDRYKDVVGMQKVKTQIEAWVRNPERLHLTESWAAARAAEVLDTGISSMRERLCLLDADENKRQSMIDEKKRKLLDARQTWEDLRRQMSQRSEGCNGRLKARADEYAATITERLQYEASHAANPPKWWKEDYPYRLKVELTNMSTGLNDTVYRIFNEDSAWFNRSLDKAFKTYVLAERSAVVDKEQLVSSLQESEMDLQNLDQKRTASRLAITAVSIASAMALNLSGLGILSVAATMGMNTGGTVFSEMFFKQKADKQRDEMKAAIAQEVPRIIDEALRDSQIKVRGIYRNTIADAVEKEKAWLEAQNAAIEGSLQVKGTQQRDKLAEQIARLEEARKRLLSI